MVDARGFKQHQNKVRSEQGALSVVKNDPADTNEYRIGFRDGWLAAIEAGVVLTKAA